MELMQKVTLPEGQLGDWRVERFTVPKENLGSFHYGHRAPEPGEYTRLMRGYTIVMSDTRAEMYDHIWAVHEAKGHCLINGLGLGMVLAACLRKPEVERVTVVESAYEVITLVGPYYADPRVELVLGDALLYDPPKGVRYGMVWHDIWDGICSDNLKQMAVLHRKYGRRAEWQGSWCRDECEYYRSRGQ